MTTTRLRVGVSLRLMVIVSLVMSLVPAVAAQGAGSASTAGRVAAVRERIGSQLQSSPNIVATKQDQIVGDDGDGLADPGEMIRYTVIVSNTSAFNAVGVNFADTIDANTTLSGTFKTTPIWRYPEQA